MHHLQYSPAATQHDGAGAAARGRNGRDAYEYQREGSMVRSSVLV